ncbi:hypothetical protein [Mycobacterium paraseoulense]|uniref:Ig-like domain-containing protein n=1 Tax=Mycobacterium paraseoulense TaxID=590652 RepID=A0A1X0IDK7_9MYCO|nr:hypothetical protein [Mycobacterium paraseoulense]MCV7397193.1 hypothetical protein [Mycobacterium paraseoulense]ORB43871.1 hypothetical protein BST39_07610 [Mycobacterium paraseoulense]BBZ69794.1 hypothetical protein MPRS_08870 [Mycobacterium paraseoulense]
MNVVSQIVVVPVAVLTMAALSLPGSAAADPPPTQQITVVAVGPSGQPINGYKETPPEGNVYAVSDCSTPSPSAVAEDVYYCSPSVAGAGTCWPSTPGSMLCVDDPWQQRLHRVSYDRPLPPVQPTATPDPFALTLDDGTHCLLRNGGAWGARTDGYEGAYSCSGTGAHLAVLWLPSQGAGSCVDRSSAVWTVKVGQLGTPGTAFPPPQTRAVTSAWFAGGKAGQ